ncbi:MAG TPA: metalloregulator ArsR/SmtB family transcription factor [Candidatus Dormibacteraeota bacterium]|jgi:DNA-binding transcriptional ArsR family regulator|nr:metalloregulator ArsR/SmtB family transcription factor [Candidatus Dormibacteraeota bacterium]
MAARVRARQTPTSFRLTVEHGTGYEALLGLSMFAGDEPQGSYEVGKAWFVKARAAAPRELTEAVRSLVGTEGAQWFLLLGMVHEAGGDQSVERLLGHLGRLPAGQVKQAFIGGRLPPGRSHDASSGAPRRLAKLGAGEVKRLTLEAIESWSRQVLPRLGDDAEVLAADARAKRQAGRRLSATRLIELATSGVVYEGEAGIDQVLLVPSVVTRPWVTISEWDSLKLICYPAQAGEPSSGDSEDQRLATIYRALGDETRLRLLRALSAGDRGVTELAEALGMAKSTIHEQLAALRSAGLIRVNIGADKRYGLRPGLPDLSRLLKDYLKH